MAIFEDEPGDYGEVPPAPWDYGDGGSSGGSTGASGYPGMNSGLPPDNAGINFPIDYSPPPGMGTDTDMGNPFDSSPSDGGGGYFASLGGGGGGSRSYASGPSIPQDVLRQFINLLRYGGVQRI